MKHVVEWTAAVALAALTLQWAVSVVRASAAVLAITAGAFLAARCLLSYSRNRW